MLWKATAANAPFWTILFIWTSTFLGSLTSAAPVNNVSPWSTIQNADSSNSQGRETLFRSLQAQSRHDNDTHFDKRDTPLGDDKYAWEITADPATFAFGPYLNNHESQEGTVVLEKEIGKGVHGVVTQATLSYAGTEGRPVAAKLALHGGAWTGATLVQEIGEDPHLPIIYEKLRVPELSSSLILMNKLGKSAEEWWNELGRQNLLGEIDWQEGVEQATKVLVRAHKKKIVHLDFKLENMLAPLEPRSSLASRSTLISSSWTWTVIDWDQGINLGDYEKTGQTIFPDLRTDPRYASPEMLMGDWPKYVYVQDVYQLAMALLQTIHFDLHGFQQVSLELRKRPQVTTKQALLVILGKKYYPYNDRAQTLAILKKFYKPNFKVAGTKDFWKFMASALCGPKHRISLTEFQMKLQTVKLPASQ